MRRVTGILMAVGLLVFGSIGYLAGDAHLLRPSSLAAADDCQMFPQTGFQACGDFLAYWNNHGGLAQQGYPISAPFQEKSDTDGKTYMVQYFERAVFEAHPENAAPNNVLLSLLGSQKYKAKYPNGAPTGGAAASTAVATTQAAAPPPATAAGAYPLRKASGALGVTLYAVKDPDVSDSLFGPKAGNRCISFDVQIDNQGSKDFYAGDSRAAIKTDDNRQYSNGLCSDLQPDVAYGNLVAGNKVRGWVSFEIPTGAKLSVFQWKGDGTDAVTFTF